jgi:tripartite-type tricarboxylate transporter receptor subunit TctC
MNAIGFGSVNSAGFAAAQRPSRRSRWQRWFQRAILFFGVGLALIGAAAAQDYPTRQIVMIVPFPAGGATDILARILSEPMRAALGQSVVVQNVPGAGSTIGVGRAIQSAPDGYTLSIGNWTSHVGASAVYPVTWNVLTDLEPVAILSTTTLIIVGRSGLPVSNGKELIAWLKANPDQATAATVGAGSGAHICGVYFEQRTGTRVRYVPYRGGAPVMADLLANQVDIFCGEASQMLPHFKAGKIKPLVVMSKSRWAPLPEVPNMEDVGASDTHIAFWQGLWVPKGTPRPIIAKLSDAVTRAFADPIVIKRLTELGQDLPARGQTTPQALAAFHKSEVAKWWPLIKGANIKVE